MCMCTYTCTAIVHIYIHVRTCIYIYLDHVFLFCFWQRDILKTSCFVVIAWSESRHIAVNLSLVNHSVNYLNVIVCRNGDDDVCV